MCQNNETIEQAIQHDLQFPGREWHPSDCVQEQAVADNRLLVGVGKTLNLERRRRRKKKLTPDDRNLLSEELRNLYSSRNITVIVPWRNRWARSVAGIGHIKYTKYIGRKIHFRGLEIDHTITRKCREKGFKD